jgi:hypothetical protein
MDEQQQSAAPSDFDVDVGGSLEECVKMAGRRLLGHTLVSLDRAIGARGRSYQGTIERMRELATVSGYPRTMDDSWTAAGFSDGF